MMMKIICLIAIVSLIYSNCIYAIGVDTLGVVSPLTIPDDVEAVRNLGRIFDITDGEISRIVYESRNLFARLLGDEPDGISIFLNKGLKEIFIFSNKGLVHIYGDSYTKIPAQRIQSHSISNIKIDIYPFTPALIGFLKKGIEDFVLIEGAPSPDYTGEQGIEIVERHIRSFEDLRDVLPESLRRYISALTSAVYAKVPDKIKAELWKDGVPGLVKGREVENAVKIRDYIINYGGNLDIGPDYSWINFIVWDGNNGEDKDINEIIERNVARLFSRMPDEEREALLYSLNKHLRGERIAISILDSSRHWLTNCRGDRFIGINRALLAKIVETLKGLADEINGENRPDEIARIENLLYAQEAYLQTYIYHELRHEAFIEERKLLGERVYEIDDMSFSDMQTLIERLPEAERKEFDAELERRQNGSDARYFVDICGVRYEEFLRCLLEQGILDVDSLFLHAAAICGFSQEVPVGSDGHKHYNELTIDDFSGIPRDKPARMVYKKYEAEYTGMYRKDKDGTESRYRGKISYLLYEIGLNAHIRVDTWKKENAYDRNLAKEYIIRLIDFTSRYERYLKFVPGRGEISMFRKRERPLSYRDAAQLLLVSLLGSGDYSQAVLRTELGFKTSGIVNTVTGNKFEFWKLIEEACEEQVRKGDARFLGITAEAMKSASIEKELLPRMRIVILFRDYLDALPGAKFSRPYMDIFHSLAQKYYQYKAGRKVDFDNRDLENFDKLYKKVCKLLAEVFDVIIGDEDDLLLALWDTFEFVKNLTGNLNCLFSEPLFANGTKGDETRFEAREIDEIRELKKVFDKEDRIKLTDIRAESTERRVQLVWSIYKIKVLKYREGLCNILNRYGTDREISGNRVWDLLRQTRGWSSAVWLAREYSRLFGEGVIEESLDLDSGLSVFYYALSEIYGIEHGMLSGLKDVISDPAAEYFGINPNRLSGDFTDGSLVDMRTGNAVPLEQESQDLVLSVYRLHTTTSPQKMYNIFRNAHRALKYGGHLAITLPYGRIFTEESLRVLKEKLGFEPVVSPGITWNVLSEDSRKGIIARFGEEEAERVERELFKNRFYVIILKKTGVIKEGEEELRDKFLLLPEVLTDREIGKPIMPEVTVPEEEEEGEEELRKTIVDEAGWTSAGVLDGITFHGGEVAGKLEEGLGESRSIKEKAENIGAISEYQDVIRELLEEEVVPGIRLEDFINEDLRERIDKALKYNDSDYTTDIEEELFELTDELEKLKRFIIENYAEFTEKIKEIRDRENLANNLAASDTEKYNRIIKYTITDLNETTLQEVRDIYRKLIETERQLLEEAKKRTERERFIDENWERFQELQRLLRRYSAVEESSWYVKNIRDVLSVEAKQNLTEGVMSKAEDAEKRIARRLSTTKRIFNSLKEFEEAINELFKWIDCEFIFGFTDMKFLSTLKIEWEKDELGREWLDYIGRLHLFMDVLDEWEILKDCIDWEKGLAVLLKDKPESEYMRILDEELLYKPFLAERGIKVPVAMTLSPGAPTQGVGRRGKGEGLVGEELVISVNGLLGITDDFLGTLEELGFEIRNIYEVWLEPDVLEGFMRRRKRIIVVRKIRESAVAAPGSFSLQMEKEDAQDYSNFMNIRGRLLQEFSSSDFHIHSRELLCRRQIAVMEPEWAKIYMGKEEWIGVLFDKKKVEEAVEVYRRKQEEERKRKEKEERKREEREAKLIKSAGTPFAKITYEGIWKESMVRDLAQILLRLNIDFENPQVGKIAGHPLIAGHPQLGGIPQDELTKKIEELIRYRQYELRIERLYKELSRMTQIFFQPGLCKINVSVEIDGIKRTVALADVNEPGKTLRWHIYTNGDSASPFRKSHEEWYSEITGNLLALRRLEPRRIFDAPVEKRRLVIHCLSDRDGLFKKLGGGFKGVEAVTGGGRVFELLSGIYQNKNFDYRYIKELVDLAHLQLVYFLSRVQSGTLEFNEVREINTLFTSSIERLFRGEMTIDEYNEFTSGLRDRLGTISGEGLKTFELTDREIEDTKPALDSFQHYLHGQGQEKEIEILDDDTILSKYAEGKAKIKHYYDALYLLRSARLYELSEEERNILSGLINRMLSGDMESKDEIISYLKVDNTVNRYLYFSFIYLSRVWGQESLDEITQWHNNVTEEILKTEPQLSAYTTDASGVNIITLLTELYRLKQMLEDASLESGRMEVQLAVNRLISIIWERAVDRGLLHELNKMTEEMLVNKVLMECDLSFIGNPCHIDLTKKAVIGLEHLMDYDRYTILSGLETPLGENVKHLIEGVVEELRILFIYHPRERQAALDNAAWAIARSAGENVRLFMDIFRRHNPGELGELNELIRQKGRAVSRDSRYRKMVMILGMAVENPDPDSRELNDAIKRSQWFRCWLLDVLNKTALSGAYQRQCDGLIDSIFRYMDNPYDIYNNVKSLITKSFYDRTGSVYAYILVKGIKRMEDFMRDDGRKREIIDILTRTYNQFLLMWEFIAAGLDSSGLFRRFIAGLFFSKNSIAAGYAYEYIKGYLEDVKNMKEKLIPGTDRIENIHEIFLYIIAGLLENGDNIESVRTRRMLELFAYSAAHIPGVRLDKEWLDIIGRYKRGEIGKETLLAIWRNAKWMIEDTCDELGDKTKIPEIESRFGLNILTGEVEKSDAYFCEMKDEEIDPQIRWLLEKHPERYRFIQGKSTEGEQGRLDVPNNYIQAILSAWDIVKQDWGEENDYGIAVLKGVSFSGHYSAKRGGRIYIPYEILKFADSEILIDFIEHEYLHTKGWDEEDIIRHSKEKRPGIYEKARGLYREYIAERLANTVKGIKGAEILRDKMDRILRRVQEGKRIELSETQLARLLWLIDRSREINIVPEIAGLIDLILEPNYAGDPGQVVMAVEKAILAHLYTEEQFTLTLSPGAPTQGVGRRGKGEGMSAEEKNLIHIHRTHTGLRFEGKELPPEVKNVINYVYRFNVPEPASVKGIHYVLIDEYRAEKYEDVIKEVSKKWGVRFITEIPEGVNKDEVVVLIDPEDAGEYKGFQWYLPLLYSKKSFELAAWLSINKPENLTGTPVYEFVKRIYEGLLGEELDDKDVISWFRNPQGLKDRISSLSENLKLLRIAFMQLDVSA